jgi:hypothetical protein
MRFACACVSILLCFCACNQPTSPKDNSNSGPLVTASISDGSGTFSYHGSTTVSDWLAGQYQVSVAAIEAVAPLRQIHIIVYCKTTDAGVAIPLNDLNSTASGQGLYTNGSQSTSPYAGPTAETSGTVTFDNLAPGTNTISGTFSFVAKRQTDGALVTVSSGTFGK